MNKVVFYLMGEKGYNVLLDFINMFDSSYIKFLVLSEDNNIKKDYFIELCDLCKKNDIEYYIRGEKIPIHQGFKFAISWRWLIPDSQKLIVLHDSILPRYRGFAPLVNMLINGEEYIGVTALFATEKYDNGKIIDKKKIKIEYPIKIQEAIIKIKPLYSQLVNEISSKIFENSKIESSVQNEDEASYSLWRDQKDYLIDWNNSSSFIKRFVDAVGYPYNGACSYVNNLKIIITDVEEVKEVKIENRDVGKVIFTENGFPVVVCGHGLLIIKMAYEEKSRNSFLPLKNFRSRFGGRNDYI